MATVSVRYIVDDVDAAIEFYCGRLGFHEDMHPAPTFAMLSRGDLRLVLSAPGGGGGGGQSMPDGTAPEPGGWNRFALEVADLEGIVGGLRAAGISFRNDIVKGVGGKQILIQDPAGNPVELFEPSIDEARLGIAASESRDEVQPIGWVESPLDDLDSAPKQGDEGAPDAWLVFRPDVAEGIRDLRVGAEILVLTWLDRGRRDVLSAHPRGDATRPALGVFSTRSPDRPNPIGLHRVSIVATAPGRVQVNDLEAIDGTPIVDVKPVLEAKGER
jgi:tRNA-Thr(GGU) m(6)t(6)A37 methyltransferase TsaA